MINYWPKLESDQMIEVIVKEDLDWVMQITQEFNDTYFDVPLNYDKARDFIAMIIDSPASIGFRSETGYIIGGIEEDPFRDYVILKEYGWFSKDRSGIALLQEFEDHARACGVNEVRMTTLGSNKRVAKLLHKLGYAELETSHIKRF